MLLTVLCQRHEQTAFLRIHHHVDKEKICTISEFCSIERSREKKLKNFSLNALVWNSIVHRFLNLLIIFQNKEYARDVTSYVKTGP